LILALLLIASTQAHTQQNILAEQPSLATVYVLSEMATLLKSGVK